MSESEREGEEGGAASGAQGDEDGAASGAQGGGEGEGGENEGGGCGKENTKKAQEDAETRGIEAERSERTSKHEWGGRRRRREMSGSKASWKITRTTPTRCAAHPTHSRAASLSKK